MARPERAALFGSTRISVVRCSSTPMGGCRMKATPTLFEIRRLGYRDWPSYRDIRREAVVECPEEFGIAVEQEFAQSDQWYPNRLATSLVLGGFDQGGGLLGTVALDLRQTIAGSEVAVLSGMYMRTHARRSGRSRQLLQAAIFHAFERSPTIVLAVTFSNEQARLLYLAAGFREWKADPPEAGGDLPAGEVLMRLDREDHSPTNGNSRRL